MLMTLVAIWRISLRCRVFSAKMVMRSGKERTASSFVAENPFNRARMKISFGQISNEGSPP